MRETYLDQVKRLTARVAELEKENARLRGDDVAQRFSDIETRIRNFDRRLSQCSVADLGKR